MTDSKQPKHIAVDAEAFLRHEDGIGRYVKELFSELIAQTDYTFELVGFRDQKSLHRLIPESKRVTYTFLPIPRRAYSAIFKHFYALPVDRWLSRTPDAAIYPNFVHKPYIEDAPRIVIIHDVAFVDRPQTLSRRNLSYLERHAPASIKRAAKVMGISHFSAQRIHELFQVPLSEIGVVSPGINQRHFGKKPKPEVLNKYDLKQGYLLALGTIEPRKNHHTLIAAYMMLPEQLRRERQLVLAGRPGWRTEKLTARITELQRAGEQIVVTGFFDDEDLPSLLSYAGIFVQASTYEGFGIPPLEAMAMGTPVVSSDISALAEAVGDAAEIIDPHDARSIADGITHVLSSPQRQKELTERGRTQARSFTWSASAATLKSAIEEVTTESTQ